MIDGVVGLGLIHWRLYNDSTYKYGAEFPRLGDYVYLIQLFGCDMGFRFIWGERGPYAALGEWLFEAIQMPFIWQGRVLPAEDQMALDRAFEFGAALSSRQLRLLCSLHFLRHVAKWLPDRSDLALAVEMGKRGFSLEESAEAWRSLQAAGLYDITLQ